MPSPFPGMDPFLEDQVWPELHMKFIAAIHEALVPALRPRYVARMGERVYLQYEPQNGNGLIKPDAAVLQEVSPVRGAPRGGTAVLTEPIVLTLPMPEKVRETFLEIRLRETHQVVAVIEILSPTNKRRGSEGRAEYLAKREAVITSRTHLVEIDLLRGGERMPTIEPLPSCDYVVIVSRGNRRPKAEVWPLKLESRLPIIPVPLLAGDPDVPLDLQEVFNGVYDRAGYDYSINYGAPPAIPLTAGQQAFLKVSSVQNG